ncbi:hypothetical protein BDV59DRAFT_177533 [Aspergillus ambiguus]|uniref:uncharacterized protein n=1 Tax=Aspergillus ambiguus TaxID=176160 RepID=UPI003CCD3D87
MSLLHAFRPRLVQAAKPLPYTAISSFHTSSFRPGLKESDHNRDDLHNVYEAEKQDQLKHTKEGKAKWKQELASNSEASVKADRGEVDSDSKDFNEMQKKTKHLPNQGKAA